MNHAQLLDRIRTPHKRNRLVVMPSYRKGAFDSHAVDCPFVFAHEGRYGMTFVGWDAIGYRTGLAWSDDAVHWHKEGLIVDRGPKGSVTEYNAALTHMVRDNALFGPGTLKRIDGRYVGTYHAYPQPGYETGPAVIGLCFSEDLRQWEIGPPVLRPGAPDAWDGGGLYKSWIVEEGGVYYLFYNAKNRPETGNWPWLEQTGVAVSADLKRWEKHGANPVLPVGAEGSFDAVFASDPCVLRHEDTWILFYYTLDRAGVARDSVAFSHDLLCWEKSGEILVDVGPAGSLDERYAHKPAILTRDRDVYHFYTAVRPAARARQGEIEHGEVRGISVARSRMWDAS